MLRQEASVPVVEAAGQPTALRRPRGAVPWLVGLVVVLVIGLLALGSVLVVPMVTTTPGEALADRTIAAWNEFDDQAIRAQYADDAIVWSSDGTTPAAAGVDEIAALAQYGGMTIERIGSVTERGNLVWYPVHVTSSYDVSGSRRGRRALPRRRADRTTLGSLGRAGVIGRRTPVGWFTSLPTPPESVLHT